MIALVMDSFTDTDIFTDLLEACSQRQVKVYILLDQSSFSHFLKMCKDLGVDLEQEKVISVLGGLHCVSARRGQQAGASLLRRNETRQS